ARLIGAINAEDANSWPRCERKNAATPLSYWSPGTYTLRYIRSRLSTSSVVWSRRISPTVHGRLMAGSGRWGSLVDQLTAWRSNIGSESIASRLGPTAGAVPVFTGPMPPPYTSSV